MLDKLHKIWHEDCKMIQEFITKIRDVKSEIKNFDITINKAIIIQILNFLN